MIIYGAAASTRERHYLFVDGGCLRASVKKLCADLFNDEHAYRPHIQALANSGSFDKIFYYDAVQGKEHNEAQAVYEARVRPEHERFARIQALDRVHVALGQIVGPSKRQKGVDVRLAVDMMTHAFRGNITKATLFAGDADFVPLLKALVGEGLHVTLWHPFQANAELKGAADSTRLFEFKVHHNCLTADDVNSAFQMGSSGGGEGPVADGFAKLTRIGDFQFAGRWAEAVLRVWRGHAGDWSYVELRAPDASLARTLLAFDAIHGWGIADTGEEWIAVS